MNKLFRSLALLASLGMAAGRAYGACDASTNCEDPSSNGSTQSGWTISASGMSGIKALDSVGPNGNITGSRYFFGAVSGAGGAATLAKGSISTTGDGTQLLGLFATAPAPGLPATVVSGGNLQGMLGNQGYSIYAEACPSGASIDTARCSVWAKIGSASTLPYPATVFSAIQKPGDATINSLAVRTSVPVADVGNISQLNLEVDNLITPAQNQVLSSIGWAGNTTYTIDNTAYTNGFIPNTKYQYKGTVTYPAGVDVPTGGDQIVGSFWTTPALPGSVTTSNITHCSVQITAQNSAGSPANPSYTTYNLCATGTGGSCLTNQVSGATPTDTAVVTINALNPGTAYTPTAQAQVGNGDGSQAGWNSSAVKNGSGFSTLAWGGTFTITAVTTGGATFNVSGLTGAGSIASWAVKSAGSTFFSGTGDPTGAHPLAGLLPNTTYGPVTIELTETSGCTSTLNFSPASFTTTPFAPTAGTLSPNGPRALVANFTDGSANPTVPATTYEVQVCTNAGFTTGCNSTTGTKVAGAAQSIAINTNIIPETQYFAQVRTQNRSRPTWPDSGWFNLGSATTPNEVPTVNNPTVVVHVTSATLSVTASDNAGPAGLSFLWTVNPSGTGNPTLTSATGITTINGNNATNVTQLTFNVNQTYSGSVAVTDHNGAGLTTTKAWSTSQAAQVPTSISVAPSPSTVITGNTQNFTATVLDQFGQVIANQSVNWGISGGGSLNSNNGVSTVFTAVTPNSPNPPYTLTASFPGATSGTSLVTVLAAGPQMDSLNFVMSPGNKGGTATAVGHDNVVHSINHSWSASDPLIIFSPTTGSSADGVPFNTAVVFDKAGTFTLTDSLGSGISSSTVVIVPQVLTSISVCPVGITSCSPTTPITVNALQTQQFTATGHDQFGNTMTLTNVTWAVTGCPGCVSAAGDFRSSIIGQQFTIIATDNGTGLQGAALVTVVDYNVSGAVGYPVPYKASSGLGHICFSGLGSDSRIRIYTTSGRQVFSMHSTTALDCTWDVKNSSGESLASGVYFYVIESPIGKKNGKLIIIQ